MIKNMEKTVALFHESLRCVRAGVVSTALVDTVKVSYYDQLMPIKHLANTQKIGNTIAIDPFDVSIVGTLTKSLCEAGFQAYTYSKTRVIVSVPPISGEQKKNVIARLSKLAEEAKISVRNVRKRFRQGLEKTELNGLDKEIQSLTDAHITEIETILKNKIGDL